MKKKLFAGVVIGILLIIVVMKLFGKKEVAPEERLPVVETTKPQLGTIELYTSLIGKVEPKTVARLYPEIAGTVEEVFVKAGDMILKGQPVCAVDTKQVETAENSMDNAEISSKEAQDMLWRMTALHDAGSISQVEYQGYVNTAEKADIIYKQAVEEYERQYSYSNITAPIGGRVESCDIEPLDRVSSSDQLCVISGEGNKVISSSLTENLRKQVHLGDGILAEKNGAQYTGTIVEMSEMANENTGLYDTKIQLDEAGELSTGTVVKISVCSNRVEQVLTVPVDSVYYENSVPCVYTYENGTIHKISIQTGIFDSERIEVANGLKPEMEVVTTWNPELYEGAKVTKAAPGDSAPSGEETKESEGV